MNDAEGSRPLHFVAVSLDCADPAGLGDFYLRLLGGRMLWSKEHSVGVQVPGPLLLVAQRVADYRGPVWPGQSIVHLDLSAGSDLDGPVERAVSLGARLAEPSPDNRWQVLLDPAGHPFCITTLAPSPDDLEWNRRRGSATSPTVRGESARRTIFARQPSRDDAGEH
jgi:hypothetical protein